MRLHPDLAWVTPLTSWVCKRNLHRFVGHTPVRWGHRMLERTRRDLLPAMLRGPFDGSLRATGLPETNEGHAIWNRYLSTEPDHYVDETYLTDEARSYFLDVIDWHRELFDRPRFVSKTPRNLLRMRYLQAIFPNARFVHLLRDGRAVAASILKRRRASEENDDAWWGVKPPDWQEMRGAPPIVQCAWIWVRCLEIAERDAEEAVEPDRYRTLRYETFVRSPGPILERLLAALDLDPEPIVSGRHSRFLEAIRPPATTWRDRLTSEEREQLEDYLQDHLPRYGYGNDRRAENR